MSFLAGLRSRLRQQSSHRPPPEGAAKVGVGRTSEPVEPPRPVRPGSQAVAFTTVPRVVGAAAAEPTSTPVTLPDPAEPPRRRGSWEQAALTNVAITERVKDEIRTHTPPWKK